LKEIVERGFGIRIASAANRRILAVMLNCRQITILVAFLETPFFR
jgi:hypothetical protein